jgi:hypothetical protein
LQDLEGDRIKKNSYSAPLVPVFHALSRPQPAKKKQIATDAEQGFLRFKALLVEESEKVNSYYTRKESELMKDFRFFVNTVQLNINSVPEEVKEEEGQNNFFSTALTNFNSFFMGNESVQNDSTLINNNKRIVDLENESLIGFYISTNSLISFSRNNWTSLDLFLKRSQCIDTKTRENVIDNIKKMHFMSSDRAELLKKEIVAAYAKKNTAGNLSIANTILTDELNHSAPYSQCISQ